MKEIKISNSPVSCLMECIDSGWYMLQVTRLFADKSERYLRQSQAYRFGVNPTFLACSRCDACFGWQGLHC